ncbi:MAG: AAA family ATPase [Candidatus Aenigmatarchaeota archaeon]|nr:AAA family ATPase [Candidatus Aenigmarchaeota archaeon]
MPKLLLLIVGMPGSGKTVVADIIAKKFNAAEVHSGDIIREEVRARGLKYSPTTDAAIAHWFHTGGREILIAQRIWAKVKKKRKDIVVIEGLRSPSQLKEIERLSGQKPVIINISAPFRIRHAREHKRGRFGKKESEAYLRFRDRDELKRGLGKLMRRADYRIDNRGTKKQLEKAVVALIEKLMQKYKYSKPEV